MEAQVWNAVGSQFYVKVVASNGLTLAHSESYSSKSSAMNCAKLIAADGTAVDKTA